MYQMQEKEYRNLLDQKLFRDLELMTKQKDEYEKKVQD